MQPLEYRAIFISDIHLGTRDCRADYLLDFLRNTHAETLYLVGDVVDLWAMRRHVHWPPEHSAVLQAFLDKAKQGCRVVYIPGNHDETLREFVGVIFNGIEVRRDAVHVSGDGRRFFVSHGDEFDGIVRGNPLLHVVGDRFYGLLLWLNRQANGLRRRFGRPYWSLSSWIKSRVGGAKRYVRRFEQTAARAAAHERYDGYICGHIHKAGIERYGDTLYCNDGDWVEHCTALVEDHDGRLQLLHWADHKRVDRLHQGDEVVDAALPLPGSFGGGWSPAALRSPAP